MGRFEEFHGCILTHVVLKPLQVYYPVEFTSRVNKSCKLQACRAASGFVSRTSMGVFILLFS